MEFLIGIFGLTFIIFIHELGHYIVAKLFKVEVLEFSIGFGKKIFRKKFLETEFCISIIPIGGYCKIKGEESLREAIEKKLQYIPQEENSLFSLAPFKRILISLAGPFANFFTSILFFAFIFLFDHDYYSYGNKIIISEDVPAAKMGLQDGDKILKVENIETLNFLKIQKEIQNNIDKNEIELEIESIKDNSIKTIKVPFKKLESEKRKIIGIAPWIDLYIEELGDKEKIAGLKKGDLVLEIDDKEVKNLKDFLNTFSQIKGKYKIKYKRNENIIETQALPNYGENGVKFINLAFKIDKFKSEKIGLFESLGKGLNQSIESIYETFKIIKRIFIGNIEVKDAVSGPLKITYYMSQAVKGEPQDDFSNKFFGFISILGRLSIALFFGNLLPFPPLDGSYVILYSIEMLSGKKIKVKYIKAYFYIALVMIALFFCLSIYSDISFLLKLKS